MEEKLKGYSKKVVFLFLVLPLWGMLLTSTGYSQEMTGRQIMEEQKTRQTVETEYGEEIMMLVDGKSGEKEKREIKRYAKKMDNDLNRYLLVFTAPADIKGTALLTHEQETEDDQWLYMPATQKMQRIAAGSKKSYFMGTDFTYEDMEPEKIENFEYKVVKSETLDQVEPAAECWVIEAVPAQDEQKRSSGYSKRILWVDKANFTSLKVEFYDRRNRLIKTQKAFEIENISGTVFRPKKVIMDNHKKDHKTLSLVTKREINSEIKDQTFTERFILSNQHDK